MHPVLTVIEWGGRQRPLGSYGALLALALVLGSALCVRAAARAGLDVGATIATLAISVGCAFLGADLVFVVVSWLHGARLEDALWHPGLVFYGGAVAGWLGGLVAGRALGLPVARLLDSIVPALPVGQAIGRVGCLLGGCCFGAPYAGPFAVSYTHPLAPAAHWPGPRHPWPLYEAGLLLLLALFFALWPVQRARDGERFALYVVAYACVRAGLEPLRGDVVRGLYLGGVVSTSQLLALASGLLAVAVVLVRRRVGSKRAAASRVAHLASRCT
ncbi:MAG TPA: prolipoprotein diacylglyceryl transferase family protein [Polyangiales bacterium]